MVENNIMGDDEIKSHQEEQDITLYQYNLPMRVNPKIMGLIVVDMQNDFVHPDGALGKQGFKVDNLELLIGKINNLIKISKSYGIPVIGTRHIIRQNKRGEAEGGGLWVEMRQFLKHEGFREGTWGAELVEGLEPPEFIINKPRFSAFYETDLETLLRGVKVESIIFSGVATNVCVESTIRDAFFRDFRVISVEDCMGAYTREAHEGSLRTLRFLGSVRLLNEVSDLLNERRD